MTFPTRRTLFGRLPGRERSEILRALRAETTGGILLLMAAVIAITWANSPWGHSYEVVADLEFGPSALGLHMSVENWAADGLLTIFFLVAGIELKREFVVGELRNPAAAALPIVAAFCGMLVPAGLYLAITGLGGGDLTGWAIPMATDIAFALAVLSVIGTNLPSAVRAFLLTLAVVDDLGAIIVIAAFYTATINWLAFGGALVGLVIFALLQRFNVRGWYFYIPLGLAVWALMHASGIHATVAGVAMGLLLRTSARTGETEAPGERTEHLLRPISAGFAVPMFALFSAGVVLSASALKDMVSSPEPLAIVVGLVVGKTIGIFLGTYFAVKFTKAELNPDLAWEDVLSVAVLAGIGFTVSLLISGLAFDYPKLEEIKASVLLASVLAAGLASALIKRRNRVYRALCEAEANDSEASNGVKTVG